MPCGHASALHKKFLVPAGTWICSPMQERRSQVHKVAALLVSCGEGGFPGVRTRDKLNGVPQVWANRQTTLTLPAHWRYMFAGQCHPWGYSWCHAPENADCCQNLWKNISVAGIMLSVDVSFQWCVPRMPKLFTLCDMLSVCCSRFGSFICFPWLMTACEMGPLHATLGDVHSS